MSEYQYYEFRALDRLLTDRDMRELRAISTRASISRTSFSNHYEYGDLKANPRDLLLSYFDASLYFAHWLYAEVAFKYPKDAVDLKMLRRYAAGQSLQITNEGTARRRHDVRRARGRRRCGGRHELAVALDRSARRHRQR